MTRENSKGGLVRTDPKDEVVADDNDNPCIEIDAAPEKTNAGNTLIASASQPMAAMSCAATSIRLSRGDLLVKRRSNLRFESPAGCWQGC